MIQNIPYCLKFSGHFWTQFDALSLIEFSGHLFVYIESVKEFFTQSNDGLSLLQV